MTNSFSQGSVHDQQNSIFEFVGRWDEFEQFPNVCVQHYNKSKEDVFSDLIDAYFGECAAVQSMILKALCILYAFDGVGRQSVMDLIKRVREEAHSILEERLLDRLERVITTV